MVANKLWEVQRMVIFRTSIPEALMIGFTAIHLNLRFRMITTYGCAIQCYWLAVAACEATNESLYDL